MTNVQNSDLKKVKEWLVSAFSKFDFIDDLYLIGSALNKNHKDINDIDVVQRIDFDNSPKIYEYSQLLMAIRIDFAIKFSHSLHVTTFTQNELKEFDEFISKNSYIKLI